jgi:exopolysaccharide biosynthesis polyprenyl glycosylphosphotransferase
VDDEYANTGTFRASGYTLVSSLATFPVFLRENVVDEVVNALPMKSQYDQASKIVVLCAEQGIIVRSLSDIFPPPNGRIKAPPPARDSVITVYSGSMQDWRVLVKRTLDFSVALLLLLFLSPLLLVVSLLIKLSSPGPVLFVQQRVGMNKRRFPMYKFRTMIRDAETRQSELESLNEVDGPVFKIKQDPRITPLGRILRRASIDELPQLVNVLKGDMSLVGPRPLPVRDYNGFDQDWQRRRFSVRPGLTCLWQVKGRSDVSFERWMELDLEYIDNWCLSLDLRILAKTIPAVLHGSGAV